MKPANRRVACGALLFLCLAPAAVGAGPAAGPGPEKASAAKSPEPAAVSGSAIYGEYLMQHTVNADGSAVAHFTPPLAVENRLLIGAMKSLARIAYGQNGIEVKDPATFKPTIGKVIALTDLDYEYRFLLDGTQGKGIGVILVRRQEVKRPTPVPTPGASPSLIPSVGPSPGPIGQAPVPAPLPASAPAPKPR